MKIDILPVGFLETNCYIVSDNGNRAAVIDPGDESERILSFLRKADLKCEIILLTHGHFDHVGAVTDIINVTSAKLAMNGIERGAVQKRIDIEAEDGVIIKAGDIEFTPIAAPGHSPGSMCYLAGDTLFSGDTLFFESIGRTDLPGGNHSSMLETLKKLSRLNYTDLRVLPGHFRETSLAYERKNNPYLK